jgi:DNA-binding response OmpR family regulator
MARSEADSGPKAAGDVVVVVGRHAPDTKELVEILVARGIRVDYVDDPEAVARAVVARRTDAIVVDLRDDDRIASGIVDWLYRNGAGNALAITELGDVDARLRVLELGLTDHLIAPFATREAVARVLQLIARRRTNRKPQIEAGDLTLDVAQRAVERAGQVVTLTPREVDVFATLIEHAQQPVSKRELLNRVWGGDICSENVVEANVSSLRRKLHALGPPVIHTVHRSGYAFRPVVVGPPDALRALVGERNHLTRERDEMVARREEILQRIRSYRGS